MNEITLRAAVTLSTGQAKGIALGVLWQLVGEGECIEGDMVMTTARHGLFSAPLEPLRPATDLDRAVFLVLAHLTGEARQTTPSTPTPTSKG